MFFRKKESDRLEKYEYESKIKIISLEEQQERLENRIRNLQEGLSSLEKIFEQISFPKEKIRPQNFIFSEEFINSLMKGITYFDPRMWFIGLLNRVDLAKNQSKHITDYNNLYCAALLKCIMVVDIDFDASIRLWIGSKVFRLDFSREFTLIYFPEPLKMYDMDLTIHNISDESLAVYLFGAKIFLR